MPRTIPGQGVYTVMEKEYKGGITCENVFCNSANCGEKVVYC